MSNISIVDEQPLTPEDYRALERDLLQGLLDAAEDLKTETVEVTISRKINGIQRDYFSFRIRPLAEVEYMDCRKQSTTWGRAKQLGNIKVPEDQDQARFHSLLIYTATVKEDRARLWDNVEAQRQVGAKGPIDLIELTLKPGEKFQIVEKIDELSGYNASLEETVKNS